MTTAYGPANGARADVAPGCLNLLEGGNFEQLSPNWQIQPSTRPPMYTNEQTFNGSGQALRLGNGLELPNIESVSEVRYKPVLLPFGASRIILRFLYYPLYDAAPGEDLQQADLFDASNDQLILSLLNVQDNSRTWKLRDFDLTPYAGRSVSIRFRVRNDGGPGRTLMYIDNVELEYCAQAPLPTFTATGTGTATTFPQPTSTPTASPTGATIVTVFPTSTATPIVPTVEPGCTNILVNGGFEGNDGWIFGEDPVPPRLVSDTRQEGARAVLLGNPPESGTNVVTFSSIRQLVTIPWTVGRVELRWWQLLRTDQAGGPTATTDRQDLILLTSGLKPITILRRQLSNANIWQMDVVDLTPYRGQTLFIYFNAFNDGNGARTLMYLDDVQLNLCGAIATNISGAPTPSATFTAAPLPTQSPTPLPTLTAIILPTLPPTATSVAVQAAPQAPITPASSPTPLATATSNVYAIPTLPPNTTLQETLTPAVAVGVTVENGTPISYPESPTATSRPAWLDRLGAVAVLGGIVVLIGFIAVAIVRIFQRNATI
ncbi:MAG: hypothetical protein R3C14_54485 [Caldilineaceae bacterium]